jgi:hypothetical protein
VSLHWSNDPQGRDADPELACAIARALCRDSLVWARTLVASTAAAHLTPRNSLPESSLDTSHTTRGGASAEGEMFVEVLAYSLRLLEMRLAHAAYAGGALFAARVRQECSVLTGQAGWRDEYRLKVPGALLADSRYAQLSLAQASENPGRARVTKEMFEQFCGCTGLGSDVLVGSGENLASLVFYIATHSVLSAGGLPTREQVQKLLRAAGECRRKIQASISEMLPDQLPSTHPATELTPSLPCPALPKPLAESHPPAENQISMP